MASYLTLAYRALKAAGHIGTVGSLERKIADGLASLGSFGGADVGALAGSGRPFRQLANAMDPAPEHRGGSIYRTLVGGGPKHFLAAVSAAIAGGGGGGGDDPVPPWLDDISPEDVAAGGGGFEFSEGEAYINGVHITDLSQVFTGYEPGRKTVDGYDFGDYTDVSGHYLDWQIDLLALVASFDFAFRMEFRATPGFYGLGLAYFLGDVTSAQARADGNPGDSFLAVYDDNTADASQYFGPVNANTWYTLAASNNVEGWRTTFNGGPTKVDPLQSTGTCTQVNIGSIGGGFARMNGHIKKLTFRPNGMDDAALRAWANA